MKINKGKLIHVEVTFCQENTLESKIRILPSMTQIHSYGNNRSNSENNNYDNNNKTIVVTITINPKMYCSNNIMQLSVESPD
jgi:hypothetical protein